MAKKDKRSTVIEKVDIKYMSIGDIKALNLPDEACVDYKCYDDWGYPSCDIYFSYSRPETDEEMEKRLFQEKDFSEKIKQKELEELAKLKAKYES